MSRWMERKASTLPEDAVLAYLGDARRYGIEPRIPGFATAALTFALGACCAFYAWIIGAVPGDYQGDTADYFYYAARIRDWSYGFDPNSYLRGLVYPAFLAVTWGGTGFWTYVIQGAVFFGALSLSARVLARGTLFGLIPIAAAMVPHVAYLQNMLYPDGILLSLTLLFFCALAARRWSVAIILALTLTLTKLLFIVTLPVVLAVWALQTWPLRRVVLLRAAALCVGLVPVLAIAFPAVFRDLGYMVTFARAHSHGHSVDRMFPKDDVRFSCGGRTHVLPRADVFFDPITVPHQVATYGPFTEAQAREFECSRSDLWRIKGELLSKGMLEQPLIHARLAAEFFGRALVGASTFPHTHHMLMNRWGIWQQNFSPAMIYTPAELVVIQSLSTSGFKVQTGGPSFVYALQGWADTTGIPAIRALTIALIAFWLARGWTTGNLGPSLRDPGVQGIAFFLLAYSVFLAVSAPFLVDRYTMVNFLAFPMLAARLAAIVAVPAALASTRHAADIQLRSEPGLGPRVRTWKAHRRDVRQAYRRTRFSAVSWRTHLREAE